ncbi:hypothetical protein T4D_6964 [Trichinella pseudospiralis]|uniref:Integrase catalytic domain-containing protein n=1 Tax=Trichinella pseudospiralis TaxID=6337 RepID=A0A0V1F801_TRIPS|nr:hypothetical protein T4D_6964 [Trichinella pseudospiralis]
MEEHDHLKGLKLADQFPRGEVEIDLLIRIDHYYDIVLNEIKKGGYIETDSSENDIWLGHLWKKRSPESNTSLTLDVLERLKNEVRFDGEQYVVKLPWKSTEVQILNNYEQAERRLQQIYDPLGYLTPFIVRAKTLIQELWQRGLHWKDPLPDDLKTTWTRWITEWKKIRNVRTPRCLIEIPTKNIIRLELHGFNDASERAYGGAVYIKMIDAEGKGAIKLIVVKSKIAPLKSVTLPRLELVTALVTAKLISHLKQVIDLNIDTLNYLLLDSKRSTNLETILESIYELVKPENWGYCPTKDNPANVITRGTTLKKLKDNHLWWNGPKWLHNENQWPKERLQRTVTKKIENIIEEEQRPTLAMLNVNVTIPPIFEFERFGYFKKMLRLTAYCKRFVSNCNTSPERRKLGEN